MKFYVVWKGRKIGVFNTWKECQESVFGFAGARYKSFPTKEEAEKAFSQTEKPILYNSPVRALYADGGVIGGSRSFVGGTWAWVAVSKPETEPIILNGFEVGGIDSKAKLLDSASGFIRGEATNNLTEFVAAVEALESRERGWSGRFLSDSRLTIGRLFYGWKTDVGLNTEILDRAKRALDRLGTVTPIHLDGHPSVVQLKQGFGKRGNPVSKWNKMCDELCNMEKEGK